jgi:hypothetical protein
MEDAMSKNAAVEEVEDVELDAETVEGEEGEEERKGRPVHPAVGSEDTAVYPFRYPAPKVERDGKIISEEDAGNFPPDYDFKEHAPLKKKDFGNEFSYFTYKFKRAQLEAERFQTRANEALQMGGITSDADAKKFLRLSQKMAELRELLGTKGIDPDALLAELEAAGA